MTSDDFFSCEDTNEFLACVWCR